MAAGGKWRRAVAGTAAAIVVVETENSGGQGALNGGGLAVVSFDFVLAHGAIVVNIALWAVDATVGRGVRWGMHVRRGQPF